MAHIYNEAFIKTKRIVWILYKHSEHYSVNSQAYFVH